MKPDAIRNIPLSYDKSRGGSLYLCVNSFPGSVRVDDFSGSGFMPGGVQIIRLVGERCVN